MTRTSEELPTAVTGPLTTLAWSGPTTVLPPVLATADPEFTTVTPRRSVRTDVEDRVATTVGRGRGAGVVVLGGGTSTVVVVGATAGNGPAWPTTATGRLSTGPTARARATTTPVAAEAAMRVNPRRMARR